MITVLSNLKLIPKWLLLLLAFTPLIVSRNVLFPFVFSKVLFIRLIVALFSIALAVYVLHAKRTGKKLPSFDRLKNPLFIAIGLFILVVVVSTLLGVNPYRSFFGDVERGEGLITLLYVLVVMSGAVVLFRRRDWTIFFKLSSLVGIVVAVDVISQFLKGIDARPDGSFIGNPSFVALYLLFSIFSLLVVFANRDKKRDLWFYLFPIGTFLSLWGILLTKTRGALIGAVVGMICVALWAWLKEHNLKTPLFGRSVSLRRLAKIFLLFTLIFFTLFVFTRSSLIWQKIPGLDRLSQISVEDQTTRVRLINTAVGFRSINPAEVGPLRFLFGWGPENFSIAYEQHYDPAIQKYEASWFDRAHNRLIDVLVMNGVVGLLSYLYLWSALLYLILKRKALCEDNNRKNILTIGVLFFAVSYFAQNLFLFDQIVGYVPLFMFFGYVVVEFGGRENRAERIENLDTERTASKYYVVGSMLLAIIMSVAFIMLAYIPYRQMSLFLGFTKSGDIEILREGLDDMVYPDNYVQGEVRQKLVVMPRSLFMEPGAKDLAYKILSLNQESIDRASVKPRTKGSLGYATTFIGKLYGDNNLIEKGGELFTEVLAEAPGRQEIYYQLAANMVAQGRFDEAEALIFKAVELEPEGLRAGLFYRLILMPYDWEDEHNTFEQLTDAHLNKGRLLSSIETAHYRDSYDNYLSYMFRVKDIISFERTFERAIRTEEALREINDAQLERGVTQEHIQTNEAPMKINLEKLRLDGWKAVSAG